MLYALVALKRLVLDEIAEYLSRNELSMKLAQIAFSFSHKKVKSLSASTQQLPLGCLGFL